MPTEKKIPINYTSRDYASIRESLMEHARRYYPNTYKDFNEASFGSLVLDTVSYVGDVLSFYIDYQANESFLETASEYKNVIKLMQISLMTSYCRHQVKFRTSAESNKVRLMAFSRVLLQ